MKSNENVNPNPSNPQEHPNENLNLELDKTIIETGLRVLLEQAQAGDSEASQELREIAAQLKEASRATNELPDPPVSIVDTSGYPPVISREELIAYTNSEHTYRIARADFEMKHAALRLKLLLGCTPDRDGDFGARLDRDGRIVFTEICKSCGPENVTRS